MDLQRLRCRKGKCLVLGIICCLLFIIVLSLYPLQDLSACSIPSPAVDLSVLCKEAKRKCTFNNNEDSSLKHANPPDQVIPPAEGEAPSELDKEGQPPHKMALIVPYRDRLEELLQFAPYMHKYLKDKHIAHQIYVINQVDNYRFNRASLINVGFLESRSDCDYIAMHDVDLLPRNPTLNYGYPEEGPFHVASPEYHPKYNYSKFVGGILLMNKDNFIRVNGMSNRYWGWGREDDELYVRLLKARLQIRRPTGLETGRKDTFLHNHNAMRTRDNKRFFNQTRLTSRLDRETGVSTVKYSVDHRVNLVIDGAPVTMLNVRLKCDLEKTKWCLKKEDHDKLYRSAANFIINN
ncbi:beta-1,4-galactosyltransferase 7-like [Mizuhopecten yessoensis]|uniref:Beta-1,4-galactosyltransferase n=1 Tax=Mizuhopecten yessoensis TaxID=6573 RepID=A0A210PYD1_MIZYE|nr:beta-1,4-galactosyltransferase 7-like [Mizuhopecten yessoensis]OWF41498.1 Beta-1,4-galactosyltransferase 7 [Mizuhopecten yessoensis]